MNPIPASQIADIAGATVTAGDPGVTVTSGVCTDTRKLVPGCAFFALKGENFDGDGFAASALENGASVAVVSTWKGGEVPADKAVIEVSDPLLALQKLACWWRKQLDIPVVCITGSNGKTSTKDFTTAVLAQRFRVSATKGNLNNHIGVPLTVLSTSQDDEAAVWEIGMNHSGELAPLCEIIRPKFGIITNIGTAHIEFLGSRDAIAEEKSTLARALPSEGILFIPVACDYNEYLRQRTKAHIVSVGNGRGLVRAENPHFAADHSRFSLVIEGLGSIDLTLRVPGRHMVTNALLAAAAGWKLGLTLEEIAAGLESATLTGGRLALYQSRGVSVIDDTYNANPESMAAAIETLADTPVVNGGRRIIVLGKMGELGTHGPAAHQRTGELAARRKLQVVAVGEGAEGIADGAGGAPYFPDLTTAADWLAREAKAGDVVLFKGSRTAAVERVMNSAFPRP
ncbi:MAG: UDP-N-acetylmuramoyl-tripeptide--D-alanyl-D-alanine ligase [Akkermansiaceae bacterium]|nr:UDP-N-acetylmuramoyl-tripeptide--D-alanyl-D-alanine ligase [Akkermansiaceae bacterium]MCP5549213.1 UDP-N-acetylmuramoyl-tripeptide--D-alanyl-D-alanine ligase [Akkermansiaceae bacterium]